MSEEEKTIEERAETIIDAIEPETEDDVREAFEINKEDGPQAVLGAPVLRDGGDPEPADMNMIHKHLDNFLAKIAGETPIDDNVRTSTEYWLKRLADGLGGSTKKIYQHTVYFQRGGNASYVTYARVRGYLHIYNNDATPLTESAFKAIILTPDFKSVVYNGYGKDDGAADFLGTYQVTKIRTTSSSNLDVYYIDADDMTEKSFSISPGTGWVTITDNNVIALN